MKKMTRMAGLRLFSGAFALVVSLAVAGIAGAQDYVGVLPELLKPEIAQRLELTEDQVAEVRKLIAQRTSGAIGLSQLVREAPPAEQKQMRVDFNAESEKLGFALLNEKQQAGLKEIRVGWMGMLSLEDEPVASGLNLADWQRAIVSEWINKVRDNRRGPTAQKTRDEAERAIRKELSESQWAAWQVLAGKIEASTAGAPTPPDRNAAKVAGVTGQSATEPSANAELPIDEVRLEINFQGEPWDNVLKWLATQADMAMQSDVFPPGSFTYRDRSRGYTVGESIDIMNASMLSTGYTLVRRGRLMKCIDLEQPLSKEVIKEFAEFVKTPEELAKRGDFEPVRFLFSLSRLDPDASKSEIESMLSILGSVASLPSAGQIAVTDTAGNVRAIAAMLKRAEDPMSARGSTIVEFKLTHITAEEVLTAARPLLGLPAEQNTSPDLSLATDTFGTVIYGTGKADKLQQLRDLVKLMDTAPSEQDQSAGRTENSEVKRHRVKGGDLEIAYQVVSQLLAGLPDVRLAKDEVAKMLVLQARSAEHKLVEDTLATLAGESSDFKVIQLQKLDTRLAIDAIKKFFGIADTKDADASGPVIDGDQFARQVWVKGSATEVEQIRTFIEELEKNAEATDLLGEKVRMIPLTGRSAMSTLQQAQELWNQTNGKNKIRFIKPGGDTASPGLPQRATNPDSKIMRDDEVKAPQQAEPKESGSKGKEARRTIILRPNRLLGDARESEALNESAPVGRLASLITKPQESGAGAVVGTQASQVGASQVGASQVQASQLGGAKAADVKAAEKPVAEGVGSDIVIMQGPGGLIVTSEDKAALEQFDRLVRMLSEQSQMGTGEPTVIYLQNIKAAAAKELLETIMSGSTGSSSGGGSLLGDLAGGVMGGGMFGALLGGGGSSSSSSSSTSGMASGDYTITADPRLNCLIINASPQDMALCEELLKVIDQVESPYSIETKGQLALIPVISQDVSQVLATLKTLYADRIEGAAAGGGGGANRQPDPRELIEALRGGGGARGGRGGASSELKESKIALSADTNTNTLIVIAQPQVIKEIETLIQAIDEAGGGDGEETITVVPIPGGTQGKSLGQALSRALGAKAKVNTTPAEGSNPSSPQAQQGGGSSNSSSEDDARRRAEFFQRMRDSGAFGGGGQSGGRTFTLPSSGGTRSSGNSGRGGR